MGIIFVAISDFDKSIKDKRIICIMKDQKTQIIYFYTF